MLFFTLFLVTSYINISSIYIICDYPQVPDVEAACERFESLGVSFIKRPNEGRMKGLAFIRDPDGYWIEIFNANCVAQ